MNSEQLYLLIQNWLNKLWISDLHISYNHQIFKKAINIFYFDYLRWFPNDKSIIIDKLLLTPQLIAILCYRISRLYYIDEIDGGGGVKRT